VFGTKDNWHSEKGQKTKTRGNGQKQSQGNLKTVKLTDKQSYGTSHSLHSENSQKSRHGQAENWGNV
jgi:hypothetical protein